MWLGCGGSNSIVNCFRARAPYILLEHTMLWHIMNSYSITRAKWSQGSKFKKAAVSSGVGAIRELRGGGGGGMINEIFI